MKSFIYRKDVPKRRSVSTVINLVISESTVNSFGRMQQVHQLRNKGILCLLLLLKKTAVRQSASSLSMDGCKRHMY